MFSCDEPNELAQALYMNLRDLAQRQLAGERVDHTLQPTALAHEVYLRLQTLESQCKWQGRDHFMAVAAETMRRILVDHARRKISEKRGGNRKRVPLRDVSTEVTLSDSEILAVHEALDSLAEEEPVAAELVKLRVFAGFTQSAAAQHLDLNKAKADRLWAFSKARLLVLMGGRDKD